MSTAYETPPAATGGAGTNDSAGKQPNARSDAQDAQPPEFWTSPAQEPYEIEEYDLPASLIVRPPGLVGDLADYFYATASRPMLEAAMLASLGLMAGISGRCYNLNGDGLNLYLMLLAPTGYGKSAMSKGIDRVVDAVRDNGVFMVEDYLGAADFSSGQALVREVAENPSFLCVFGEFGLKLKALSDPRANASETELLRVLLDLYNKSGQFDYLRPRKYADRDKNTKITRSPAVSILCESTPDIVYENLGYNDIRSGLLPRFLLLECTGERRPRNPDAGKRPPDEVIERLTALVTTALHMRNNTSYCPVLLDATAAAIFEEVEADIDATYNEANPAERELWNRAMQNIGRVSALLAVGCNHDTPVITAECANWAKEFVCGSIETLERKFSLNLVGTGEARQEAELKKYIGEYMRMTSDQRRRYKVPHALCETPGAIGLDYLRRRARSCVAFTQDRRGLNMALDSSLIALCKSGYLLKLPANAVHQRFGLRQDLYALGSG